MPLPLLKPAAPVVSSGHALLDEVARKHILASSGRFKRPKMIGSERITVVEEVRFQFGLRGGAGAAPQKRLRFFSVFCYTRQLARKDTEVWQSG